ncbi:MAG: ligase-associated DNA damage response DEXH box helicase, partial [Chloroflexota bacterium]
VDTRLQPLEAWFTRQGWTPFPFQHEVWRAYLDGESGLVHSPTGTGKTYSVFPGALVEWMEDNPPPYPTEVKRAKTPPLHVLWITPMRALAGDTAKSLQTLVDAFGLPWSLETRTGDTSSTVRGRQSRKLPTVLVTTPESLSLLLSRKNARDLFKHLRLVVVDEWHELMASKRGVQTELGMARLRHWQPDLRIWGLSATLGNLDTALQTLLGAVNPHTGEIPQGRLVKGDLSKKIVIDSVIPPVIERFPWAGHLGLKLLPQVIAAVDESKTSLVFTNTRSQTESWFQAILDERPDWAGIIALHHSSLSRDTRRFVEDSLRDGTMKCVVCTSSLDLGVDFPTVDRVMQVSSPKGIARLVQRAGRSGHQPYAVSRVTSVPTHALELVEVAAVRHAVQQGNIEARQPILNPLDVLIQHLVTVGLGGGFDGTLYDEVRTTVAFSHLSHDEWQWALDFVMRGGDSLKAYEQYQRVQEQDGRYHVPDKRIATTHRMNIGTITGDASLKVKYLSGKEVGFIEESFISRLKPGDKFTLGGRVLKYLRMKDMEVVVRRDKGTKGVVPRWYGGRLPLSTELTDAVRYLLNHPDDSLEMKALAPLLALQRKWSRIPPMDGLLVECVKTRDGFHLFFYPFEGRAVHEGLAALVAYRLSQQKPITFTLASNDYSFELLSPDEVTLNEKMIREIFSPTNLLDDILAAMNASEMARRQFREVARVSGLANGRYPGGQKSSRQLQASSGLIYDVLENYDPENLLLEQARREVLERQLDQSRLTEALKRIAHGEVILTAPPRPTPFAFPLLVDRLRQTVSSETLEDRILKMVTRYEKAADA